MSTWMQEICVHMNRLFSVNPVETLYLYYILSSKISLKVTIFFPILFFSVVEAPWLCPLHSDLSRAGCMKKGSLHFVRRLVNQTEIKQLSRWLLSFVKCKITSLVLGGWNTLRTFQIFRAAVITCIYKENTDWGKAIFQLPQSMVGKFTAIQE